MKHCGRCNNPYAGHDCSCPCHAAKRAAKAAERAEKNSFITFDDGQRLDLTDYDRHHKRHG